MNEEQLSIQMYQCPCGKTGSFNEVRAHKGGSHDDHCKSGPIKRINTEAVQPNLPQPVIPENDDDEEEEVPSGRVPVEEEGFPQVYDEEQSPESAYPGDDGLVEYEAPVGRSSLSPPAVSTGTSRGGNGQVPGIDQEQQVSITAVRDQVTIPSHLITFYNWFRTDEHYDGTLEEWIIECVELFLQASGLKLQVVHAGGETYDIAEGRPKGY